MGEAGVFLTMNVIYSFNLNCLMEQNELEQCKAQIHDLQKQVFPLGIIILKAENDRGIAQ